MQKQLLQSHPAFRRWSIPKLVSAYIIENSNAFLVNGEKEFIFLEEVATQLFRFFSAFSCFYSFGVSNFHILVTRSFAINQWIISYHLGLDGPIAWKSCRFNCSYTLFLELLMKRLDRKEIHKWSKGPRGVPIRWSTIKAKCIFLWYGPSITGLTRWMVWVS